MKRTHALVAGVVAGMSLAVAAATWAQPWGGMGYGGGPGAGMGPGYGHMGGWGPGAGGMGYGGGPGAGMGPGGYHMGGWGPGAGGNPAEWAGARLDAMKAQLNLTTEQMPAWDAYATQVKAQAAGMQAIHAQMWNATGTAPERATAHAALMEQRAKGMSDVAKAFATLYNELTPEQKAIVDQGGCPGGQGGPRYGRRAG